MSSLFSWYPCKDDPLYAVALEIQELRGEAQRKLSLLAEKADVVTAASASLQDLGNVMQVLAPVVSRFGGAGGGGDSTTSTEDDADQETSLQGVSEVVIICFPSSWLEVALARSV